MSFFSGKKSQVSRRRGFSLIEIVTVAAFMVFISAVVVVNLFGKKSRVDLDTLTRNVVATLREAQSRSVSQEGGSAWGVHFDNSTAVPFYALFKGAYSPGNAFGYYRMPKSICFASSTVSSGGKVDILFGTISGTLPTSTSISLLLTTGCTNSTVDVPVLNRTVSGKIFFDDLASGLGNWTVDAGTWVTGSNTFTIHATATDQTPYMHVTGQTISDGVVEVQVSNSDASVGRGGPFVRGSSTSTNFYELPELRFGTDQLGTVYRYDVPATKHTVISSSTTANNKKDTFYNLRGSINGTSLKGWEDGAYNTSGTTSTISAAGNVGIFWVASPPKVSTGTFKDFSYYTTSTITMSNLPVGYAWAVRSSGYSLISPCLTGSAWDTSSSTTQIPIDYELGGGSVVVWATSTCNAGGDSVSSSSGGFGGIVGYPSSTCLLNCPSSGGIGGAANDIFGGDTYSYSTSTAVTSNPGLIQASSTITVNANGSVSF